MAFENRRFFLHLQPAFRTILSFCLFIFLCLQGRAQFSQGFNATTIPPCWSQQGVVGNAPLTYRSSSSSPTTAPAEGSHFVHFNSYSYSRGTETRLVSPRLSSGASAAVSFSWFHYNSASYAFSDEGVQVQYSLDGRTWTNAGAFITRLDASLASNGTQWKVKTITLPAGALNKPTLYIGFKFRSSFGYNMSLDNVTSTGITVPAATCPSCPPSLSTPIPTIDINPTTISVSWSAVDGVSGYEYAVTTSSTPPASGTLTNNTFFSSAYNNTSPPYIHVRSVCGLNFSAWSSTCKAVPGTLSGGGNFCTGSTVNLAIANPLANQTYTWYKNDQWETINVTTRSFQITSSAEEGRYTISAGSGTCEATLFGNEIVRFNNPENFAVRAYATNSVSFGWDAEEAGTNYEYSVTTSAAPPLSGTATTLNSLTVNGLLPNTTYYIHARAGCGSSGAFNPWKSLSVKTLSAPCPLSLEAPSPVSDITATTGGVQGMISVSWSAVAGASEYEYAVTTSSTPPTSGNLITDTYFSTPYDETTLPFIHVRSVCGRTGFSEWTTVCNAVPGSLSGTGSYCIGENVSVGIPTTLEGQTYTWTKDGSGTPYEKDGNGGAQSYNFSLSASTESQLEGTYQVVVTRPGCEATTFGNAVVKYFYPKNIVLTSYSGNTASFAWDSEDNNASYQYSVSASATPPASGTPTSQTYCTVNDLTTNTQYYIHVRARCSPNSTDYNEWNTLPFTTTRSSAPDCSTGPVIQLCTEVTAFFPAGLGAWDFEGTYPVNGTGVPTPGREMIYQFTPAVTGIYYIETTGGSGSGSFFYKPASAGCTPTGWTAINLFGAGSNKIPIGRLQAGTTYLIVVDPDKVVLEGSLSKTFKICKATVAAPVNTSSQCTAPTFSSMSIPANSPKEEFYIDNTGNVVAALDFSKVSNAVGQVTLRYDLNSGDVRRNGNIEYMDRNYTVTTTNAPADPIGIKLFFNNSELQRLISEPNDGTADVSSINEIDATIAKQNCGTTSIPWSTAFTEQTGNGALDAVASYVQFNTAGQGTFFLHKGPDPIAVGDVKVCTGQWISLNVPYLGAGSTYQWQVDEGKGAGFVNLVFDPLYSGINSTNLGISNPPSSFYGYRYRCVSTGNGQTITSTAKRLTFAATWTGNINTDWQNPGNWSCNKVPDANTDITIENKPNLPVVNANVSCRSLLLKPGANMTVATGVQLTITGK